MIICPNCNVRTKVVDTVYFENAIYRRRKCPTCEELYYTKEEECKISEARIALYSKSMKRKK